MTQTDETDASTTDYPLQERLAAHPLGSRVVYRELEHADEPLEIRELATRLRTPERTVRKGLKRLLDDGVVNRHVLPEDRRRTIYTLADAPRDEGRA